MASALSSYRDKVSRQPVFRYWDRGPWFEVAISGGEGCNLREVCARTVPSLTWAIPRLSPRRLDHPPGPPKLATEGERGSPSAADQGILDG